MVHKYVRDIRTRRRRQELLVLPPRTHFAYAPNFALDVFAAAFILALPAKPEANAALTRLPIPAFALLAAAGDVTSAPILLAVVDAAACASATFAIAPKLACADHAWASGARRANEPKLPLADTSAGAWMIAFAPALEGACAVAEYAHPSAITVVATSRESFCIAV